MKKISWGIVGAGGIADRRAMPALLKDKNSKLTAIFERREESARALSQKYGVDYYLDLEQMLKTADIDAVYIGTPVYAHYEQAMLALKYGKHVFLEKPIAMDGAQSEKLVKAFKDANLQLTVGYMMKYHNLHQKAKEIVFSNQVGSVNDVRAQFSCWYPDIKGAWRQKKELAGGGAIMDLGVHAIELIEFILQDEIIDVKSFYATQNFNYEVEDGAVIIFKTKKGALGHIDVNFNIPDDASESKLEIYGDKGYVICKGTLGQLENGKLSHLYAQQGDYSAIQDRKTLKAIEYDGEGNDLYLKQFEEFVKIVSGGKCEYFYADKAVHVQRVVDKIYLDGNKF